MVFVRHVVPNCVRSFTEILNSFCSFRPAVTRMHINTLSINEHRKEKKPCRINTITSKIATLLTLETLKWEYSFATDVFTELGSLLSGTSRHCSVLGAPDVSEHEHFGTRNFGTYYIRYIVSTGHAQFGTYTCSHFVTCHIGTSMIQDCITTLFPVMCPSSSHGKSVQALIRLYLLHSVCDRLG